MRVITGTAKGRKLVTLPGDDVRPTTERVKEAVFSAIQFDIEGRRFLDLFAGSGQMGIEALSRGAEFACFNDASDQSISVINKNLASTGFAAKAEVSRADYSLFLKRTTKQFDIAFLDPPYHIGVLADALEKTAAVMSDYGIIICEYPPDVEIMDEVSGFKIAKRYHYGKINVCLYRKGE